MPASLFVWKPVNRWIKIAVSLRANMKPKNVKTNKYNWIVFLVYRFAPSFPNLEERMIRQVFIMVVALIGAGFLWAQDDANADLRRLAGTWSAQVQEAGGKPIPEKDREILKKMKLVVKGSDYIVFFDDEKMSTGTFQLDASKQPRTIDATRGDGEARGKIEPGIYRFKGDDFEVVFASTGQPRPTEFRTRPNTQEMLIVYKRIGK